jgi:hypothetical protein
MSDLGSSAFGSSQSSSLAGRPAGSVGDVAPCAVAAPRAPSAACADAGVRPAGADVVRQAAAEAVTHERRAEAGRVGALGLPAWGEPSHELIVLLAGLRAAVTRYMGERRDAGVPVERALAEVKVLVREAHVAERWHDPSDAVLGQTVRWAIAAYYDESAHAARAD